MTKPLSLILPEIEAVWCYEPQRFHAMKQRLDAQDYALVLQSPVPTKHKGVQAGVWDDEDDSDAPTKPYKVENGIALLNLSGPMTKQYSWLSYYYGGTSTQVLRNLIRLAVSDPDVSAILLIVYSPGGQVAGTQDLAQDIAWASSQKPFLSLIEDLGCSAAYWAASQAGAGLYLNNASATAGSVGTVMGVDDTSKANEMAGVKTWMITSGDRKAIGADGTEITDAQLAYLQSYIDSVNVAFLSSVKAARNLSEAQLKDVQRAGVYVGQDAVKIGLVDGIAGLDQCKVKLQQKIKQAQNTMRTSAASVAPDVTASPTDITDVLATQAVETSSPAVLPIAETTVAAQAAPAPQPQAAPPAITPTPNRSMPNNPTGGEGKPMKEILVRILSAMKLHKMAVAVTSCTNDSPESIAQTMAEQVNAEVEDRINNHPLMLACAGAGISSPHDLGRVLDMKAHGERYVQDLRDDAKAEAIRAYGPEAGSRIGATVDRLSPQEVKSMRDGWRTEANQKFGIASDGTAPARVTASSANLALNAEETNTVETKSAWEKLTKQQQEIAVKLGHGATPEAKERYATNYLNSLSK